MALAIDVRDESIESYHDIVDEMAEYHRDGISTESIERVIVTQEQHDRLLSDSNMVSISASEVDEGEESTVGGLNVVVA